MFERRSSQDIRQIKQLFFSEKWDFLLYQANNSTANVLTFPVIIGENTNKSRLNNFEVILHLF